MFGPFSVPNCPNQCLWTHGNPGPLGLQHGPHAHREPLGPLGVASENGKYIIYFTNIFFISELFTVAKTKSVTIYDISINSGLHKKLSVRFWLK